MIYTKNSVYTTEQVKKFLLKYNHCTLSQNDIVDLVNFFLSMKVGTWIKINYLTSLDNKNIVPVTIEFVHEQYNCWLVRGDIVIQDFNLSADKVVSILIQYVLTRNSGFRRFQVRDGGFHEMCAKKMHSSRKY